VVGDYSLRLSLLLVFFATVHFPDFLVRASKLARPPKSVATTGATMRCVNPSKVVYTKPASRTSVTISLAANAALHAKLAEMMVQMFVHQLCPLVRRQVSEKSVRMLRAALRPTHRKAVNQCAQAFAFLP
jgi:hypothetical protein